MESKHDIIMSTTSETEFFACSIVRSVYNGCSGIFGSRGFCRVWTAIMATHLTILSLDVSEVKCDSCPPSPHGNNGCDVYPFSDISDEESSPYTLDDDVLSWCHPDRAINVDGLKLYCQSAERSFFHRLVTGTVDVTDPMMCLEHNDDPSVMAVFERVVLLIANVYQCTTITHMMTTITAYASSVIDDKSLLLTVANMIDGIMSGMSEQASLPSLKEIWDTWHAIKNSEIVTKIKKVVAVLASAGLCSFASLKFSSEIFESQWARGAFDLITSSNIIDYAMDAFTCVYERGLRAYNAGSIWEFFSDASIKEFDEKFAILMALESAYYNGGLDHNQAIKSNVAYDVVLAEAASMLKLFREKETNPYTKNILDVKFQKIVQLQSDIISYNTSETIRAAPFAILLCGPTSVGKSALTPDIANMLLRRKNGTACPRQIVSLNGDDKFASEYKPEHEVVILDDVGNTQPIYVERPHTRAIIDFVNNNPVKALKADVTQKGKVSLRPSFIIATANTKDLQAGLYSTCPISVLRRFNAIITVEVKPAHRLRDTAMLDPASMGPPGTNDAWYFRVERAVPSRDAARGPDQADFDVIDDLIHIGANDLLRYLGDASVTHRLIQDSLVQGARMMYETPLCPHNSYVGICSDCIGTVPHIAEPANNQVMELDNQGSDEFLARLALNTYWWMRFGDNTIPGARYIHEKCGEWYLTRFYRGNSITMYTLIVSSVIAAAFYAYFNRFGLVAVVMPFMAWVYVRLVTQDVLHMAVSAYVVKTPVSILAINEYTNWRRGLAKIAAFAAIMYSIKRMFKIAGVLDHQGGIQSLPSPDVNPRPNPWVRAHVVEQEFNVDTRRATTDQLVALVTKKLAYATITYNDGNTCGVNIFPIESNVWVIPYHIAKKGISKVDVKYTDGKGISHNSVTNVNEGSWERINSSDMVVICLPNAGAQRDMTKWLPLTYAETAFSAHIVSKTSDLEVESGDVRAEPGVFPMSDGMYHCLNYNAPFPTRAGMCMSPIINNGVSKAIVGFHTMGATGARAGQAQQVTLSDYLSARDRMRAKTSLNVPAASFDELVLQSAEHGIELTGSLHYKSPFNYLDRPGSAQLFGSHTGVRRTNRSRVTPSIISDAVEAIMGVPRQHGPPEHIGDYKPWRIDAEGLTHIVDIPLQWFEPAVNDFTKLVIDFARHDIDRVRAISPLPHEAVLSGVDGVVGIDRVTLSTSAGWPYLCGKMKYVDIGTVEYEGITEVVIPNAEMQESIDGLEAVYAKGYRAFNPFRVSLKDEPTKIGKIKVRTIAGSSLELLYLTRKYFLPIAKWIRDNNLKMECAIGIVAQGPEWDHLARHASAYGPDHMVAGDYAGFDTSMSLRATYACFCVMIQIATLAGYTEESITVMWAIATEICEPMYEFNGEFVMIRGSNPSGHPLTIFINNWVNSLYMRAAYYMIYNNMPNTSFSRGVRLVTYGDDNISSVASHARLFNHTSVKNALASFGIVYTMADKVAQSIPYIPLADVTFLKRAFVKDESTGCYFGPLEEASMFKMLHCTSGSTALTLEQLAAEAISNFYQESFWHGEQYYNEKRPQLLRVLEECSLETYLPNTTIPTYADYRESIMERYTTYLNTSRLD